MSWTFALATAGYNRSEFLFIWAQLILSSVAVGRRRTPLVGVSLSTRCHRHMDSARIIELLVSVMLHFTVEADDGLFDVRLGSQ